MGGPQLLVVERKQSPRIYYRYGFIGLYNFGNVEDDFGEWKIDLFFGSTVGRPFNEFKKKSCWWERGLVSSFITRTRCAGSLRKRIVILFHNSRDKFLDRWSILFTA
jgi:hypothetical protein